MFVKPTNPSLISIEQASDLLEHGKRQELLADIERLSGFEALRFTTLVLPLIHNTAVYCQHLPETINSYYALPGGLLDHALERTFAGLELFYQYVINDHAKLSDKQQLWFYALISAAMLQGIGKLYVGYKIDIFDIAGKLLKPWNPLIEDLTSVGTYYTYTFEQGQQDELQRYLNVLLARNLMPETGFAWIASDPEVLSVWLSLLHEDWESAGTLGAILIRADALAIQRYFAELMAQIPASRGERTNRAQLFLDNPSESIDEKERTVGIEFIQWVTKMLESGQIMINKAPLFMVPGGLVMSVEMFRMFIQTHPEYKSLQAVQNGLLSLGIHKLQAGEIVLENYGIVLPEQVKVYDVNSDTVETVAAEALPSGKPLLSLNASGGWNHPTTSHTFNIRLQGK